MDFRIVLIAGICWMIATAGLGCGEGHVGCDADAECDSGETCQEFDHPDDTVDSAAKCVECIDHDDCDDAFCSDDGECVECADDSHCPGEIGCSGQPQWECHECGTDEDCPDGTGCRKSDIPDSLHQNVPVCVPQCDPVSSGPPNDPICVDWCINDYKDLRRHVDEEDCQTLGCGHSDDEPGGDAHCEMP